MICKKCGYQNHSNAVFCSGCGTKLVNSERNICPKCGAENEPNAVFCDHCGANLKNDQHIPVKVIVSTAIIALIVILGTITGVIKFGGEKSEGPTHAENGTYTAEHDQTNVSDTKDNLISQYKNHMKATDSVIQTDDYGEAYCEDEFVFDTTIRRDQVKRIIFLNTLDAVPQTAYDISEDIDGSVMAWMGDGDYLYIAADGMIIAPEDCSGMFANYSALEEICFNDCFDTTYVVYRKTLNNNWERVGKFDVNGQSEVVKTFEFDQPISFRELAVAAPSGRQFSFSVQMWFDDWKFQN